MIAYRTIQPSDYPALGRIIVETWQFDQMVGSARSADHFGQSYLLSCLLQQTFTCVALVDGQPAGIIVGSDRRRGRRRWHWGAWFRALCHTVPLLFDSSFRRAGRTWSGYGEALAALDRQVDIPFAAEVSLFLVGAPYRGLGLGKALYQRLLDEFDRTGVGPFFLHTDTGCNYPFYERQGLVRLAEAATAFSYAGVEHVTVFVYGRRE